MSKHTPGPWKQAIAADDRTLMIWSGAYPIAVIRDAHEKEANAKLIAAAPYLLAVVQLIIKEWEAPTEGVERGELIARLSQYSNIARAALKKSGGGIMLDSEQVKISALFIRAYNGRMNFMTPNLIEYGRAGDFVYEFSYGYGFSNEKIYGVTVLRKCGAKVPELCKGGFTNKQEAENHIKELNEL